MPYRRLLAVTLFLAVAGLSQAAPAAAAPAPAARPADVASPTAILQACYDVISGPAGQVRDWDRFRSLFVPGARLIAVAAARGGPMHLRVMTPDEYATQAGARLEKAGFFERSTNNHEDRYGDIAQIFSTYESRHNANDAKPFARGINSFQLYYDGSRWWIVTIYWQAESAANPIPKAYLPGGGGK